MLISFIRARTTRAPRDSYTWNVTTILYRVYQLRARLEFTHVLASTTIQTICEREGGEARTLDPPGYKSLRRNQEPSRYIRGNVSILPRAFR